MMLRKYTYTHATDSKCFLPRIPHERFKKWKSELISPSGAGDASWLNPTRPAHKVA